MPLPASTASRTRIHVRHIALERWRRDDGLRDIEARLTDIKDQDCHLVSGMRLRGFRREASALFDTVRGCSHLAELLNSLPTAAIQTFASEMRDMDGRTPGVKPFQLDQCHALDTASETVRRYYPRWFRSNKTGT
ncbi:MAG: hypothetical protein FD157_84 [Rhodocyclaceae bacterium]|jgi:hypothetical protein|nr:MAG: hypothetical protein FD157_84 [Rhodocyclaceae bacterium]TND04902.1 MAG: hypothetical protein FD118_721 [Rhodocyclaceae bacterium]